MSHQTEKQPAIAEVDGEAGSIMFQTGQGGRSDGPWPDAVIADALAAIAAGAITAGGPFALGCYEISGPRRKR
jgi:hypothetical protein